MQRHKIIWGQLYDNGLGVSQNHKEANKWYKLAAEQGAGLAQMNLGVNYGTGKGVSQDFTRSLMWVILASINGEEERATKGAKTSCNANDKRANGTGKKFGYRMYRERIERVLIK